MAEKKKPDWPKEPPSEEFLRCITDSGSIVTECDFCGRTHFADSERAGDWSCGELVRLRENAAKEPDKYIGDATVDSVSTGHLDGKRFVRGCPCNSARRYEDFIWNNARWIADYLRRRSETEFEEAKDRLKSLRVARVLAGDMDLTAIDRVIEEVEENEKKTKELEVE